MTDLELNPANLQAELGEAIQRCRQLNQEAEDLRQQAKKDQARIAELEGQLKAHESSTISRGG